MDGIEVIWGQMREDAVGVGYIPWLLPHKLCCVILHKVFPQIVVNSLNEDGLKVQLF